MTLEINTLFQQNRPGIETPAKPTDSSTSDVLIEPRSGCARWFAMPLCKMHSKRHSLAAMRDGSGYAEEDEGY